MARILQRCYGTIVSLCSSKLEKQQVCHEELSKIKNKIKGSARNGGAGHDAEEAQWMFSKVLPAPVSKVKVVAFGGVSDISLYL